MRIIHLSAECYPAAKAGGLADVVGSLPKYLNQLGHHCEVVIPKYDNQWIGSQEYETVFEGAFSMAADQVKFTVQKMTDNKLGFPFYVIDIPGRFDRPGIYIDPWSGHGYWDELERFVSFQIAALEWMRVRDEKPEVVHCHDHHTGLVPFMLSQCNRYRDMSDIPTVLTVHNAEYHGEHELDNFKLLPAFNIDNLGLLDWDGRLNSLASGLKCAWQITTVSKNYMSELSEESSGLELLFQQERKKSTGIVNGIDTEVWDPNTDELIEYNFGYRNRKKRKAENKKYLCREFGLNPELPTISFIGRLVREKGADLLPDLFKRVMYSDVEVNFVLLGTGDPQLHQIFASMEGDHVGYFDATLEYNEKLAHQMYAGSDFILMPSRVEPCGLNQMFAMRYGTVPIVRAVGGLKDTVVDISEDEGYGITFDEFSLEAASEAIDRAVNLYVDSSQHSEVLSRIMKLDFSWKRSAQEYIKMYKALISK
ncbi:MAG: glycogen synthase [Gracilimonas sp.]|uniref:glycogen synthase n=1 Tax=Gracilimonas TaxID=649462 RepID=UPI001B0706D5|nr:glycogen/starch synthase [Gracilimonas sp.]MBO6586740.1 glycogen synthase [Gracilimonas sp.]MBO6615397.1 glycogen synthase [Gracilimonas sp.]